MKPLMTPKELMELFGIKETKMYEYVKRPDFPAFKIGKNWRIQPEELEKWIESQKEQFVYEYMFN